MYMRGNESSYVRGDMTCVCRSDLNLEKSGVRLPSTADHRLGRHLWCNCAMSLEKGLLQILHGHDRVHRIYASDDAHGLIIGRKLSALQLLIHQHCYGVDLQTVILH